MDGLLCFKGDANPADLAPAWRPAGRAHMPHHRGRNQGRCGVCLFSFFI